MVSATRGVSSGRNTPLYSMNLKPKEAQMANTYAGEFYCVKCKEKREATGDIVVNDKGTRMAKASCPVCGTKLNRILGKA